MPPARGTKTLAWFMDTDILKNQGAGGGAADGVQQHQMNGGAPAWSMAQRRGSSSDESKSATTPPQSIPQSQCHLHYLTKLHRDNPQKKAKKFRKLSAQGSSRRDAYYHSSSQAMSESSEEGGAATVVPPTVMTTSSSSSSTSSGAPQPPPPSSSNGASSGANGATVNNEEYWFYDVASDGYYYEQNGAKGWRRRQPNSAVHKSNNGGKEQEVAHMNVNGQVKYNQLLAAQAAAAQAAFLQQAFHMQMAMAPPPPPPPTSSSSTTATSTTSTTAREPSGAPPTSQAGNPTMRYYDPNSDGFFYEMASVDGWKRRQPNKPVSASVPAGITRPYAQRNLNSGVAPGAPGAPIGAPSYGAALARGQFPRNTVKQPQSEDVVSEAPQHVRIHQDSTGSRATDSVSSSTSGGDHVGFSELFSSSSSATQPIQRPSALNLEQKAVSPKLENAAPSSTAALFDAMLADLNQDGYCKTPAYSNPLANYTGTQPSPAKPVGDSWNSFRSCSLFSPIKPSKRVVLGNVVGGSTAGGSLAQQPMGVGVSGVLDDMVDDDTMRMLMRDLDKLWANTPVSGLNQA